jgi:hypothetical protein
MIENAQSNEPALKQQFLVRAKAMSELPEVFRCQQVTQLLCDMLALGVRDEAEIFQTVYGDPGGREYWGAVPVANLSGWPLIENQAILVWDEGSLQTYGLVGRRSAPVAGNA